MLRNLRLGRRAGDTITDLWMDAGASGGMRKVNALRQRVPLGFPIRPEMIPVKGNQAGEFGNFEWERTARTVMGLAIGACEWVSWVAKANELRTLEGFAEGGWLIIEEGVVHFTIGFVVEMYKHTNSTVDYPEVLQGANEEVPV